MRFEGEASVSTKESLASFFEVTQLPFRSDSSDIGVLKLILSRKSFQPIASHGCARCNPAYVNTSCGTTDFTAEPWRVGTRQHRVLRSSFDHSVSNIVLQLVKRYGWSPASCGTRKTRPFSSPRSRPTDPHFLLISFTNETPASTKIHRNGRNRDTTGCLQSSEHSSCRACKHASDVHYL